jgi:hypothetical protein
LTNLFKDSGTRRVILGVLDYAEDRIQDLIETRMPKPPLSAHHPQKLSDEETTLLRQVLSRITFVKELLHLDSSLKDVPLTDICKCDSVIRHLLRAGIRTVFDMWRHDPGELRSILERSKPMGGRYELYLYFFINEE